ncbi:hypothetical protein J4E81_005923 [Alternaria sp. BMP 2799]|nr:hypothetical protein J4E81_005923 [Alternaria sp. BMP 2799]
MAQSATAGVKPMNQYETIMWEKEMKEQILCKHTMKGLNYLLNLLRLKMGDQIRKLRSPYIQTQILTSSSIVGREEEDKKKQDLAKLDQDLKDFREQWVPGR